MKWYPPVCSRDLRLYCCLFLADKIELDQISIWHSAIFEYYPNCWQFIQPFILVAYESAKVRRLSKTSALKVQFYDAKRKHERLFILSLNRWNGCGLHHCGATLVMFCWKTSFKYPPRHCIVTWPPFIVLLNRINSHVCSYTVRFSNFQQYISFTAQKKVAGAVTPKRVAIYSVITK